MAMERWIVVLTLVAGLAGVRPVTAQVTRADSAAVIQGAASELEAQGRRELAKALYEYLIRRYPGTPAALEAERRLAVARAAAQTGLDREGRVELTVWSTLFGLWLGVAVPATFGANDPEPYGLGLLIGGPAGFLASRYYTSRTWVGTGDARAITWGGMWGTWQGYGWREVLGIGTRTHEVCPGCPPAEETPSEAVFASMLVGGLAGVATGALLARSQDIPPGTATMVSFGSLWGTWFAVAAGMLGDLEGDDLLTTALLGGNAGLVSTAFLAPRWDMSRERARLVNVAGVAGLVGGLGLDLLLQPDDDKVQVAIPLATSVAGLAAGALLTRGYDRARDRDDGPDSGAMIELRDGRLGFDVPLPSPALVRQPGRDHGRLAPAVRLTLLDARF